MDAGQAVIGEAEEGEAEVDTMQTTSIVVSLQDPSTSSESENLQNCTEGEATILPIQFVHLQNEGEDQEQSDLPQEHVAETNNAVLVTEQVPEGVATPDKESLHVDSSYLVIPYPHQSIIKSVDDVSFDLCGDVECVCGGQQEVIHCSLCDVLQSWTNKDEATQHFISVHWESKLEIDEGVCAVLCCCADQEAAHYHCPYCGCTQTGQGETTQHVSACVQLWLSRRRASPTALDSEPAEKGQPPTDKPSDRLQEKLGNNYHKSIVRGLSDVKLEVCTGCCRGTRYHCPFCSYAMCKPQNASKIRQHIMTTHWKFRVEHEDMFLLKCSQPCMGMVNGRPVGGHWHCPLCTRCVASRQAINAHLGSHRRGTQQRRRTNAEWAALLGPEDANILFNLREREDGPETTQTTASVGIEGTGEEGSTQTEGWEPREQPAQVFQTVAALLTQEMLAAIPGGVSTFFSTLQEEWGLQFSTSDQWCLLQADWGTMSGVHEKLHGFLSSSAEGPRSTGVKHELASIEHMGAGGDGSVKQDFFDDEATYDSSVTWTEEGPQTAELTTAVDGSKTQPEVAGESNQQETGVQDLTATPITEGNPDRTLTPDHGQDVADAVQEQEPGMESVIHNVPKQSDKCHDVKDTPKDDSENCVHSKTGNSESEKTALEEVAKLSTPVKRGRGRPRKTIPESTPKYIKLETPQRTSSVVDSLDTSRRRRSRLPKRFQDYETQVIDTSEERPDNVAPASTSETPPTETTTPSVPVKRGRGRPPKRACPQHSHIEEPVANAKIGDQLEHSSEIQESQINPEKADEVNSLEEDTIPNGVSDQDSSKMEDVDEESTQESPERKRRRKGVVEAPEITISIDENTGNVLSVAVSGETSETSETPVKQDPKDGQTPAEESAMEQDALGGYSLVRKKKVYVCEACGRGYPNSQRYYQHVLGSNCLVKRRRDDLKFRLSNDLEAIIKEVRKEVTEPKCPLCEKLFKHVLHAQMHYAEKTCMKHSHEKRFGLERNSETGLYHCRSCNFSAAAVHQVVMHEMRKHWKKTEQCPICKKTYSSEALLREHIKAVHARGKERAVCDQCGVTVTARLLQQHIKVKHDPTYTRPKRKPLDKPLVCSQCDDFETMSYSKMKRHQDKVHRIADKQCPQCEQVFTMHGDLNRHIKLVHEGQNTATGACPQCGKTIAKKNLAAHIKMVHDKLRPHSCPVCGRAFLTKYTLQQHIDTHKPSDQRDTKFLCAFCGKGFINRTHYADHLNTHTGARPYVCNICNKTFRCNPALHKHKELHKAVSLHCSICNLYFASRKALRIHNNKEHVKSGASTFCCVCDAEYTSVATLAQHQLRCSQWQQANPHLNPNISANTNATTHVLDASLQDQMAMILQHSDLDQSTAGTYIVVEGKDGDETVMVLQSLENLEGAAAADVVQAINSQIINIQPQSTDDVTATNDVTESSDDVMDASEVMGSNSEVKAMTSSEVLAALTLAEGGEEGQEEEDGEGHMQTMQTMDMGPEDQQALLAISQEVDAQQQAMAELQEAAEQQLAAQRGESSTSLSRYLCGYCQQLFTSLEDVQTHMLADHVTADGGGEVELALHAPSAALEEEEEGMEGVDETGLL